MATVVLPTLAERRIFLNPMISTAAADLKGLWAELMDWFYDFFHPTLEGYVNFDFGSGSMVNIRVIIFGIFIGVLVASLYMVYVKNIVGAFVRKLLAEDCLSRDKAKTLSELGFERNPFVKLALRGSLLASTVVHVEGKSATEVKDAEGEESAPDEEGAVISQGESLPAATRYYIEEEKKYAAEMRFHARGSGWPTILFVLLVSVICIFVIFGFLPQILRFVDNTISIFSVKGNTVH